MNALLEVKNLKKTFKLSSKQQKLNKSKNKLKVAVDDLSFKAYENQIYGLLGPNGAGKTTTLRAIATLIKADEGDILLEGISIKDNETYFRKNIGFLTSEHKLEDFFTPSYLFDYFSKIYGLDDETIKSRKEYLFNKFEINEFMEVKISDLSTGMKQKISLVISLVHDPKIIIFDEPTNGLDIITAKTVTDFLVELKNLGKTIILSTHIFSLVEKLCDRVGIILDGKMVLDDDLENVTKNDSLENVFFDLYYKKDEAI